MPELPEVETVKRGLCKLIIGRKIKTVKSDYPKGFPNSKSDVDKFLINSTITDIRRRGKVVLIDLSTKYTLLIHLKMTGQLVFVDKNSHFGAGHPNDSLVGKLPDKSTRVIFDFNDGSTLYFNDQRKFGWVKLVPTENINDVESIKKMGPDALDPNLTPDEFIARFARRRNTSIKAALLDQSVIAGVGNIYSDEALWGAKIHPMRRVGSLSKSEFEKLYSELRFVLNLAIEKGGSTDRNYVDAEGKKGSYLKFARVFRKEGLKCPRCGHEIIKIRVAGRGTHICPNDQRL